MMRTTKNTQALIPTNRQVMDEEFLTKGELALRLKKTSRTVEAWQRMGLLPYVKIGTSVLFIWSDVVEHLSARCRVCHPLSKN